MKETILVMVPRHQQCCHNDTSNDVNTMMPAMIQFCWCWQWYHDANNGSYTRVLMVEKISWCHCREQCCDGSKDYDAVMLTPANVGINALVLTLVIVPLWPYRYGQQYLHLLPSLAKSAQVLWTYISFISLSNRNEDNHLQTWRSCDEAPSQ